MRLTLSQRLLLSLPHDAPYQTGFNGLFWVLRSFDENASGIFGKFEWFAYDFIDCETAPSPSVESRQHAAIPASSPPIWHKIYAAPRTFARIWQPTVHHDPRIGEISVMRAL